MNVFEFAFAVVVVLAVMKVIRTYLVTRAARNPQARELDERLARLENLEKRIQVLEAIVTDKGYELKREFDRL